MANQITERKLQREAERQRHEEEERKAEERVRREIEEINRRSEMERERRQVEVVSSVVCHKCRDVKTNGCLVGEAAGMAGNAAD